jgi:hypothetical protein
VPKQLWCQRVRQFRIYRLLSHEKLVLAP